MTLTNSPIRLLVKSYANGLLERDQYLEIRQQLLKKLSTKGKLSHSDLQNFLNLYMETEEQPVTRRYSASDWIIIILGLMAAAALGVILYS